MGGLVGLCFLNGPRFLPMSLFLSSGQAKSSLYIIMLFLVRESLRIQRRSGGALIVFDLSFCLELLLAEHQVGKDGQLQGMLLLF
jgi:hypothetical protein